MIRCYSNLDLVNYDIRYIGGKNKMDDSGPTASIILYFVFLLMDMFLYGFGAAIRNLNETEVSRKAEEEKDKKSEKLLQIINDPNRYINTVQLMTTLVNIIIGAVQLNFVRVLIYNGIHYLVVNELNLVNISSNAFAIIGAVISTILLLYITLTIGVLLPKKIAVKTPEKWAYICIVPVSFLMTLLSPFTGLVTITVNGILKLFGVKDNEDEADVTEEEIINMVNEGHEQGLIEASEAEMISNIFEFGDKEAQDIMTHRNNIVAIEGSTMLKDAIAFVLEGNNSRYPVYEENIDHIIGILHLKDLMRYYEAKEKQELPLTEVEGLIREVQFVPQTKNIDELFREMQAQKLQLVIVVDEYGQTDGLVAMEDILEEIVGNILDEYDEVIDHIEEKGEDEYIIEGKTLLEELEERLGITFEDEAYETLNGFMISRLDRIPEPDEEFETNYRGFNFKILSVEGKMVQSVLVTKLPDEQEEMGIEELDEK